MRKITALEVQKRNPQRVSVYLDDQFAFGLSDVEALSLRVGQCLSEAEIAELEQRDATERATGQAMNLLSYRPRSTAEVRRRLGARGCTSETIVQAVDRLSRAELLDDRAFARYWVENRLQFNPRGVAVLRQELRQKGIDDAVIEGVLTDVDEEATAAQAAAAAVHRLRGLDAATFRRKLQNYLGRRGFAYDIIAPVVERVLHEYDGEEFLEKGEDK